MFRLNPCVIPKTKNLIKNLNIKGSSFNGATPSSFDILKVHAFSPIALTSQIYSLIYWAHQNQINVSKCRKVVKT